MIRAFCTIITSDYAHYALSLRQSLLATTNEDVALYIFVSERQSDIKEKIEVNYKNTFVLFTDDLCNDGIGRDLFNKYAHSYMDAFRWSMKPVLLRFLLEEKKLGKVLYADCDLQFFSNYHFLFDLLDKNDFLISPHNRSIDAMIDADNFQKNFTEGIYNGGFIGANNNSKRIIDWWARACLFNCEINVSKGYYVDQKYLDLIPARFEKVYSLKHMGCNVSEWNRTDCKRTMKNGEVLINDTFPIVFIHFTHHTILNILYGDDVLLLSHLKKYASRLKKYNPNEDLLARYEKIHREILVSNQNRTISVRAVKNNYLKRIKQKLAAAYIGFRDN